MHEIRYAIDHAERICLFGLGHLLNDCYRQIVLAIGREPDVLCDNATEKWGRTFFGIPCVPPHELKLSGDKTFVIITIKQYEKVIEQLAGLGLRNVAVACYGRSYNTLAAIRRPISGGTAPPEVSTISVRGKWTLVTGASRGIGSVIAREMARLGSNLVVHGRRLEHLENTIESCREMGVQMVPMAADLSSREQLDRMIEQLTAHIPPLDILFNNAAVSVPSRTPGSAPIQDYLDSFAINAAAPIMFCQAVLPGMLDRGFGRIVNISSSIQHRLHEIPYACSKAALDKFVHDLAPSLEGRGVSISLVDPGWVQTDMGGVNAPSSLESVIPGAILGAILEARCNGRWFGAQDYAGLGLPEAAQKAAFLHFQQTR